MSGAIITAILAAVASIIVATLSAIGAIRAQRASAEIQREQEAEKQEREQAQERVAFEAQAYTRARESYERLVRDLENQLERNQRTLLRVQDQLDRVLTQLAEEQDVSSGLRSRVRTMQDQIGVLQDENEQFRKTIDKNQRVTGELRDDLRRAGLDIPQA